MVERTTKRPVSWLRVRNHVWDNGWFPNLGNGARFLIALCVCADRQRLPAGAEIPAAMADIQRFAGGTKSTLKRWRSDCVAAGVIEYRRGAGSGRIPYYRIDTARLAVRPAAPVGVNGGAYPGEDDDETTPAKIDPVENGPVKNGLGRGSKTALSPYRPPPDTKEEEEELASEPFSRGPEPDAPSDATDAEKATAPLSAERVVEAAHLALTGGSAMPRVDAGFYAGVAREIGELPPENLPAFADELRAYCEAERDGTDRSFWSIEARGIQIYRLLDKHGAAEGPAGGRDSDRRRELREALKALQDRGARSPDLRQVIDALRDASLVDWVRADNAAFDTLTRWCVNWWTADHEPQIRKLLRERLDAASNAPPKPRPEPAPPIPADLAVESPVEPDEPPITSADIARMREEGRRVVEAQYAAARAAEINLGTRADGDTVAHPARPGARVVRPADHERDRP